jgi:DmsE family decaheme c-type cytochrome
MSAAHIPHDFSCGSSRAAIDLLPACLLLMACRFRIRFRNPDRGARMHPSAKILAGSLLMAVALGWLAVPGTATNEPSAAQPPQATPAATYVGEETCLTCHDAQTKGYHTSAHGRASNVNAPLGARGCESCHGPGSAHVENPADAKAITRFAAGRDAADGDAACLQCHTRAAQALWAGSAHDAVNLSCASCHSVHAAKDANHRLQKARQVETCEQCHRRQVQKMRRSAHMPLHEGQLECSSCHNPHGTTGEKLLTAGGTVNATCERCHAEKRGPFLWEHAPVVENCTTCHDAHGSSNDRMLVAKEPFLCQRCHVSSQHPTTAYDMYALSNSTVANRMSGRSCAACHQNVHGSNAPSGKAFLR